MTDVITYSDDTTALLAEVEQKAPHLIITDEGGNQRIGPLTKTPTRKAGSESLAVVRHLPADLDGLTHLTIIGHIEQQNGEPVRVMGTDTLSPTDAEALYDRVYPRTPIAVTDEDGTERTVTPPDLFGAIA